jgi:hypothetical protein
MFHPVLEILSSKIREVALGVRTLEKAWLFCPLSTPKHTRGSTARQFSGLPRAAQFARSGRVVCPGFKENIWID